MKTTTPTAHTERRAMRKTQRTYTDVETGIEYSLYMDNADRYHLIIDKHQGPQAPTIGTEKNGFYICAHTAVTVKTNKKRTVFLDMGQFLGLSEGEEVVKRKFVGFNKFYKM